MTLVAVPNVVAGEQRVNDIVFANGNATKLMRRSRNVVCCGAWRVLINTNDQRSMVTVSNACARSRDAITIALFAACH